MSSGFEPVPISSQKHDPAWKHVQMYKDGDKVQLKCIYCTKIFRGGGIHRIKEHLACQKGNAATCHRVPLDVRQAMQHSLDGVVVKKGKKQKLVDDIFPSAKKSIVVHNDDVDGFGSECGMNSEMHLIANPDVLEPISSIMATPRTCLSVKPSEKRKRGRPSKNASVALTVSELGHAVPVNGSKVSSEVHLAIGRFLYDIGAPLDAVKSVYFQPMLDAVACEGTGIVGPSHRDLRGWVLRSAVDEVKSDMDYCARAWGRTGCSILVEEFNTEKTKVTLLNFFVYCSEGTMFLKSVDVTNVMDSTDSLFELFKEVVEEVGDKNVLQVITPNEDCYAAVGKKLSEAYPTLYWAPCAASSIMLMLDDFEKFEWINGVLEQCRSITRFIYNHSVVLNMMRRYTFGVDLVVPDQSISVTDFKSVKRMVEHKHNLQALVTSQEWVDSYFSKKEGALAILDLISDHSFWSSCDQVVELTYPLLRVLSIVMSEKNPAMGFVYAGVYRAKEAIKREFGKREDYLTYWNIIDERWEQHQQLPLYAAGFYLNPKFFYSLDGDVPVTIVSGMYDCIERLVSDTKVQDKIIKELNLYKVAAGDFGRKMAIRARESLLPAEWWSTYGGGCPNLSRLAVRVLSQCCSLTRCKQDLILLEQMHSAVNSLEHRRLNDQVFTQFNLRLRQMAQKDKEHDHMDPLSVEFQEYVASWITKKDSCLDDPGSSDWAAIEHPLSNQMRLKSSIIEFEDLGGGNRIAFRCPANFCFFNHTLRNLGSLFFPLFAGFNDYEIFGCVKDDEDTLANNLEGQ